MEEPDYHADERRILQHTADAIQLFAVQHSNETFAYFAFDCNAHEGEVLLCLDTQQNSVAEAKRHETYINQRRVNDLSYDDAFRLPWAIHTIQNPLTGPVLPFGNNTGDFKYQGFAESLFPEWTDFAMQDDYPEPFSESGRDYLECKLTVLFSKVIDELVERNVFDCLTRTSPFYVGFAFHDGPQLVVRLLNW